MSYDYGGMDLGLVTDLGKSIAEGLENVARNPTRAQFDAKRQQFAGEWQRKYGDTLGSRDSEFAEKREKMLKWYKEKFGKDLKEQGYQRLGVVNPYSGEYFYRYYEDEKNGGKALYGIWKEDALTYNAFREWQVQGVRRMRWQAGRGGAKTSRPEAPQKPAGEIRYKDGYPIAPDHLKIPGYTGPRWVNGLLVAP
ncbi:MAG: hypothetical protein KDB14_27595 [Planctomycetales bacterium]|nr:hypothetical protein [Planctomycetales bacterium]MCA9227996.1 hypothetical protein [Planctomycetales bacterium]